MALSGMAQRQATFMDLTLSAVTSGAAAAGAALVGVVFAPVADCIGGKRTGAGKDTHNKGGDQG
jgi:hypothetical protein